MERVQALVTYVVTFSAQGHLRSMNPLAALIAAKDLDQRRSLNRLILRSSLVLSLLISVVRSSCWPVLPVPGRAAARDNACTAPRQNGSGS